jgi:hypothetical protein
MGARPLALSLCNSGRDFSTSLRTQKLGISNVATRRLIRFSTGIMAFLDLLISLCDLANLSAGQAGSRKHRN